MNSLPFDKCITTKAGVEKIIQQVRNYRMQMEYKGVANYTEIFRGQGRDCWKLIPKIARQIQKAELIEIKERNIVRDFYDYMRNEGMLDALYEGPSKGKFEKDWLLIQQAQHYELPTRFLDWSGRWEAALCFAVADESDDTYPGQFWIYLVPDRYWISDVNSKYLDEDPFQFDKTIFLNSAMPYSENALIQIAQRRKGTQMGRFCIQPYYKVLNPLEEQKEHLPFLHKIIIPANSKKSIREELATEGITKDALLVTEPIQQANKERFKEISDKINIIVEKLTKKYGITK
jgi:hypothetical protein